MSSSSGIGCRQLWQLCVRSGGARRRRARGPRHRL